MMDVRYGDGCKTWTELWKGLGLTNLNGTNELIWNGSEQMSSEKREKKTQIALETV